MGDVSFTPGQLEKLSDEEGGMSVPFDVAYPELVESGNVPFSNESLLLQAIHDKYNMSPEEFARADLDGNGRLEAFEALRILQYISGTVGYVDLRK